jgi:hypothetical protein
VKVSLVEKAEAETFAFAPKITIPKLRPIATGSYWKLIHEEPYKNARLAEYQDMLRARGITDPQALKLLVAQLYQENGAVTADRIGDHGCSFGLIQFNACVHEHVTAKRFLQLHPEWQDYRFQLAVMADSVADRYRQFHGNMMQVIVAHNSPAAARRGTDTKAGYFRAVSKRLALLTL